MLQSFLTPQMTLEQAKDWLRGRFENGAKCPCCGQDVKLYKRKLNSTMARALILIYRYFQRPNAEEWLHVPSYLNWTQALGDVAKLHWWGVIEEKPEVRNDGSPRAGYYRITELGKAFVRNEASVIKYVYLYNKRAIRRKNPDLSRTTIVEALGDKFNYAELMQATPDDSQPAPPEPI
ncbi:MAG: hypothetical protein KJO40_18195 [Deltaproteobacteria bacterium]|nr:hypothetical protein [Deltaproteobacteria bacterium]